MPFGQWKLWAVALVTFCCKVGARMLITDLICDSNILFCPLPLFPSINQSPTICQMVPQHGDVQVVIHSIQQHQGNVNGVQYYNIMLERSDDAKDIYEEEDLWVLWCDISQQITLEHRIRI